MSAGGGEATQLLLGISTIWVTAKGLNAFLDRFRLPNVLGELATGVLFGVLLLFLPEHNFLAHQLSYIKESEVLTLLGELGIILLLFEVGLETEIRHIMAVGKEATLVALGGVVAPFLFAWLLAWLVPDMHWHTPLILFVGLVFAATSIGVTARVFKDLHALQTNDAQVVLAAAVLDDILGLILLSVIFGFIGGAAGQASAGIDTWDVLWIIGKAAVFLGAAFYLAPKITKKTFPFLFRLGRQNKISLVIWVLAFCFLLSWLASVMGLAAIVGAFAAGMALDQVQIKDFTGDTQKIEHYIAPITAFLSPIFFTKVGFSIDPTKIFAWLPLLLTLLACISKIVAGWMFLPFKTQMNRLLVGVAMMPRGEVGLVVANLGAQKGLVGGELYSALIVAVLATTLIAPIWLQFMLRDRA